MKTSTTIILILAILLTSCSKKDKINHYLNQPVTELELVNNGFYKYSYIYTHQNDEDEKDSLNGTVFKYVLYSNVKPQKQDDGKLYPMAFFGGNNTKENIDYLEKKLNNNIISYFFKNDTLKYKSILVYSINKTKQHVADFTTKEKIIKYYDSLKIPIKPIIDGKMSSVKRPTLFMINNYKTRIYYGRTGIAYDMFTNYIDNEMPYWDILGDWYSGNTYQLSE